jgi:DNA polymerase-3 subunit alpha
MSEARKTLEWFKNLFGADYYIELQRHRTLRHGANRHTYELQSAINPVLIDLAHEYGVKLICSNDSHFVNAEEADAHDCLLCMNTDKCIDDKDRLRYSKQEWIKTPEEMAEIFSDIPEALANTQEIVDKVELYDIDHAPILPKLELPVAPEDYLRQQVMQGGLERYGENFVHSPIFTQRAETELKALCANKDAVTYLLIIADLVNVAREMDIIVGPGRSSAAGSLVNYCLKITDVDPLEYGLLFERFYSGADELPKIDIDVEEDGREKLNAYLAQKYGIANVALVLGFERMRDTMRFLPKVAHVMRIPDSRFKELDIKFGLRSNVRNGGMSYVLEKVMRERQSISASELNMLKYARNLQDVICRAKCYP